MSQSSVLQEICSCIETLLEVKSTGSDEAAKLSTSKLEAVVNEFKKNTHLTFLKIESYPNLKSMINLYMTPCLEVSCKNCDILNFFQLCVVLLKLVCKALLKEENTDALEASKCKGLLSISQQMIVKKCLQFVAALGIIPNLLPRVGIPHAKRLECSEILKNVVFNSTPAQKHSQLIVCVNVFFMCLECDALQGIVMSYHGSDLLAALIQLCYAPIKKIDETKTDSASQTNSAQCSVQESDIIQKIASLTDKSPCDEKKLLFEMYQDQITLKPKLEMFMKQMSPSLLMFNLLMFQGFSRNTNKAMRVPLWFQKVCNFHMTKMLLGKHGILRLVEGVLNQTCDMNAQDIDTQHIERLNSLAKVIIFNPVEELAAAQTSRNLQHRKPVISGTYFQQLCKQVFDMLYFEGENSLQQKIINFMASSIILSVCEHDIRYSKKCFWDILLRPLHLCVNDTRKSDPIVGEHELNMCIRNLHTIFIFGDFRMSQQNIKILFPYFEVIFELYCCLENSVLFLKSQVKSIVCKILTSAEDERALTLLQFVSLNSKYSTSNVTFILAEGGVNAVTKVPEDISAIQNRCHCVFTLLSEVKNKSVTSRFLILILKTYCSVVKELEESDPEGYDEKYHLTLAFLLHEITAWEAELGEAFLSNVPEVIESLMILLENSCMNNKNQESFDEDIIMTVLMFLNSLLMMDDKLSTLDWAALQKCVPSLQKLHDSNIEHYIKAVVFNILAFIATHGASANRDSSYAEIIKKLSSEHKFGSLQEGCKNTKVKLLEERSKAKETKSNVSQQMLHKESCSTSSINPEHMASKNCDPEDLSLKGEQSCRLKCVPESTKKNRRNSKSKCSEFDSAMNDIRKSSIPTRGHGLIVLGKLISIRDVQALEHKEDILKALQENIEDEDSYIYLSAIQALSFLAEVDTDLVLPLALSLYMHPDGKKSDFTLKMGEVLLKICKSLGDMAFKYRDQLLHAYLVGARNSDPNIRSSSLSNLGEACLHLKFNIEGHWLQEILVCVQSLLTTDKDLEVQRCAVMVISLLLRGVGKDMLEVLENNIRSIYSQLKIVYSTANDDVLRLHSQLALEEINIIVRSLLSSKIPMLKQIRIL